VREERGAARGKSNTSSPYDVMRHERRREEETALEKYSVTLIAPACLWCRPLTPQPRPRPPARAPRPPTSPRPAPHRHYLPRYSDYPGEAIFQDFLSLALALVFVGAFSRYFFAFGHLADAAPLRGAETLTTFSPLRRSFFSSISSVYFHPVLGRIYVKSAIKGHACPLPLPASLSLSLSLSLCVFSFSSFFFLFTRRGNCLMLKWSYRQTR
jgi:hypothetical protein